jgi:hypothetical protein
VPMRTKPLSLAVLVLILWPPLRIHSIIVPNPKPAGNFAFYRTPSELGGS